jgi:hypothetical protein
MSDVDIRDNRAHDFDDNASDSTSAGRDDEQIKKDNELADRLSLIIEDNNERVVPLTKMIRKVSHDTHTLFWLLETEDSL